MNWETAITVFVTLIISLTFHEAAHAVVAMWCGDKTAYYGGQVTLNPLPHIQREPFGMLLLPIIVLFLTHGTSAFGFAHAPYNAEWAWRNPRKAALMSAAGPVANALLAAVAFTVMWSLGRPASHDDGRVWLIAEHFLYLNVLLAVFNVIPLPPLDGAGIVGGLVPAARRFYDALNRIPYMTLVIIVLLFHYSWLLITPVISTVFSWLPR